MLTRWQVGTASPIRSDGRHARSAAGARRRRAQDRDAAQPWAAWLVLRGLLALLVLAAATWSVLLLTQSRGGIWPVIALAAGALSLLMIGLDVRARARQRAPVAPAARADEPRHGPPAASARDRPAGAGPRGCGWLPKRGRARPRWLVAESAPPPSAAGGEIPPPARRRSHRK